MSQYEYRFDYFGADDLKDVDDDTLIRADLISTKNDGQLHLLEQLLRSDAPAVARVLNDIEEMLSEFAVLVEHEEILRDVDPWDQTLDYPHQAARSGSAGEQR
jgi:hypothetical protein